MELQLNSIFKTDVVTISELFIDGNHICDILEDRVRVLPEACPYTVKDKDCKCVEKVYGRTAIPEGTYKVKLSYSSRFKRILPEICSVPHFRGIRIHTGNQTADTEGCLIPGTWSGDKVDWVSSSKVAFDKLMKLLQKATDDKEDITITIIRS